MTNDRELLEQAAKAAGMSKLIWMTKWNPLTDDGDALRLAVKLSLNVNCDFNYSIKDSNNAYVENNTGNERNYLYAKEPEGDDPYAATRRAIVRAAAEIGRTME